MRITSRRGARGGRLSGFLRQEPSRHPLVRPRAAEIPCGIQPVRLTAVTSLISVIRLRTRRHALRRVVGAVVLVLVGQQAATRASTSCGARHDHGTPSAPMAGMTHEHDAPNGGSAPQEPASSHRSGCDHSMLADGCGLGGCPGALVSAPAATFASRPAAQPRVALGRENRPLSRDVAPDVPPPRA